MNFLMFKLALEKAEEPEIKLPTSAGSWKKQESSRKASTSALLTLGSVCPERLRPRGQQATQTPECRRAMPLVRRKRGFRVPGARLLSNPARRGSAAKA